MKLKTEIKLWVAEHPIKRSRSVVRKDDGRYNIPTPSDTLSKLKYGTNMVLNGTKWSCKHIKLWVAEHPIKRSRSVVRKDDGRYNIPTPSDTLSKLKYGTKMVLNGTKWSWKQINLWVAKHPIKRSRSVVRKDDGRYNIPTPSDTLSKLKYGTNMVLNGTTWSWKQIKLWVAEHPIKRSRSVVRKDDGRYNITTPSDTLSKLKYGTNMVPNDHQNGHSVPAKKLRTERRAMHSRGSDQKVEPVARRRVAGIISPPFWHPKQTPNTVKKKKKKKKYGTHSYNPEQLFIVKSWTSTTEMPAA